MLDNPSISKCKDKLFFSNSNISSTHLLKKSGQAQGPPAAINAL